MFGSNNIQIIFFCSTGKEMNRTQSVQLYELNLNSTIQVSLLNLWLNTVIVRYCVVSSVCCVMYSVVHYVLQLIQPPSSHRQLELVHTSLQHGAISSLCFSLFESLMSQQVIADKLLSPPQTCWRHLATCCKCWRTWTSPSISAGDRTMSSTGSLMRTE